MINLDLLFSNKGQFVSVTFKSEKKPSAKHKNVKLEKLVSGVFRAGIDFANLGSVKQGIESGERNEVQELPWGTWLQFPYTITHNEETYIRLYPTNNCKLNVTYLLNGVETTKNDWLEYLTPSDKAKAENGEKPECISVKKSNILKLG
jgi:hypothetical protein